MLQCLEANCSNPFIFTQSVTKIHRLIDKEGLLTSGVTSSGRKETFALAFSS